MDVHGVASNSKLFKMKANDPQCVCLGDVTDAVRCVTAYLHEGLSLLHHCKGVSWNPWI